MNDTIRRLLAAGLLAAAGPVAAADVADFVARGNEPAWMLQIGGAGVSLEALDPDLAFAAPEIVRGDADGKPRLTATDGGRSLVVTIDERLCADTMTGMPFPVGVALDLDGRTLAGCGGETIDAIAGGWRVIRLGDDLVPDGTVVSMDFQPPEGAAAGPLTGPLTGHVSGNSGCNRYMGPFTLTGEGLAFGPIAGTMMACPEPQMAVERRFLDLLTAVTRATPGEGGQLRLMTGDAEALVMDRIR